MLEFATSFYTTTSPLLNLSSFLIPQGVLCLLKYSIFFIDSMIFLFLVVGLCLPRLGICQEL